MSKQITYTVVDGDYSRIPIADKVYNEYLKKWFYHASALLPLLKEDLPVDGDDEVKTVGDLIRLTREGDEVPSYNHFQL